MDCSLPGSSVHGIFYAKVLEWGAVAYFQYNPLYWKGMSFLVLEIVVGLMEPVNFSFFCISGWSIDLGYCDIEWFALGTNQDCSVIFEIVPKYSI